MSMRRSHDMNRITGTHTLPLLSQIRPPTSLDAMRTVVEAGGPTDSKHTNRAGKSLANGGRRPSPCDRPGAGPNLSCGVVVSPPPESNRRPHPYHGTTGNRCVDRRYRRWRATVGAKVIGSLSAKLCALL
jgi:hypothetical protein